MCIGLYVKYPLFLSDFNQEFLDRFSKNDIRFHENPFSGGQVVPCGQTDVTKLIVKGKGHPATGLDSPKGFRVS